MKLPMAGRPKKLLVIVNPFGGDGVGRRVYMKTVEPLLQAAGITIIMKGNNSYYCTHFYCAQFHALHPSLIAPSYAALHPSLIAPSYAALHPSFDLHPVRQTALHPSLIVHSYTALFSSISIIFMLTLKFVSLCGISNFHCTCLSLALQKKQVQGKTGFFGFHEKHVYYKV
jgi:hypothetical protein